MKVRETINLLVWLGLGLSLGCGGPERVSSTCHRFPQPIKRHLMAQRDAVFRCGDGIQGTVYLRVDIAPQGSVSAEVVESTVNNKPMHACIEAAVEAAVYPPTSGKACRMRFPYRTAPLKRKL